MSLCFVNSFESPIVNTFFAKKPETVGEAFPISCEHFSTKVADSLGGTESPSAGMPLSAHTEFFYENLFTSIPESQRHSTFVVLPDSRVTSNGPHGFGNRFSAEQKRVATWL